MFPYPSGEGLHIGHYYNYAVMDSYCRWKRYRGTEVFQPFGYDSFGLPAENYARSIGGDPKEITYKNIENFRNQIVSMNTMYEEKITTSDQSYQKWTQWLFTKMVEWGLAYKKYGKVNWCDQCGTVLANEQAKDGLCERHGTSIEVKEMNQWYFKITDYKDRLIKNLDIIDYPKGTIKQQKDWLNNLHDWCISRQRKWGCPIPIEGETDTLDTFVDSSFYYLRYLTDSIDEIIPKKDYKQVDLYVGGNEHACMHLIYARFINMVLYDKGYVGCEEPFKKVIHQGMITRNGNKMSKSKNNSISPDNYDNDALRLYLMFIGHYFDGGDWNDENINGPTRFIKRMKLWLSDKEGNNSIDLDNLIANIDKYNNSFKFNKIVSTLMEFYNKNKSKSISISDKKTITNIINCFCPSF